MITVGLYLIYLSIYIMQIYRKKHTVNFRTAKMATMVVGMTSSVYAGFLIGMMLQGQLAVSTIFSILNSFIMGAIIAKPFGLHVIIETLCSNFMGSMMGAMLGSMLSSGELKVMSIFLVTLYILTMSITIIWLIRIPDSSIVSNSNSILFSVLIHLMIVSTIVFLSISGINTLWKMPEHHPHSSMRMNM